MNPDDVDRSSVVVPLFAVLGLLLLMFAIIGGLIVVAGACHVWGLP